MYSGEPFNNGTSFEVSSFEGVLRTLRILHVGSSEQRGGFSQTVWELLPSLQENPLLLFENSFSFFNFLNTISDENIQILNSSNPPSEW